MSLEKKLKVKDGVEGKVLTVDASGVMTSSNKDVDDIASATDLSNVESRVTTLEGTVDEISNQIESINGEVVE